MSDPTPLDILEEVMHTAQTLLRFPTVSTRLRNDLLGQIREYREQFAEGAVNTVAACEAIQDLYGSIYHMCDHAIGLRESQSSERTLTVFKRPVSTCCAPPASFGTPTARSRS